MTAKTVLSYLDYSRETSRVSVHTATLNAGNIAAQLALEAAFVAAVEAVSIGTLTKEQVIALETINVATPPADKDAQVERKWLVSCVDNVTGFPVSFTIPCADSQYVTNNTDLMDTGAGAGNTLLGAIEDYVLSKAGNAVTVVEIRLVGRNL